MATTVNFLLNVRVEGVCTGNDQRWYFDQKYKQCNTFRYGGCLGNENRSTFHLNIFF